MLNRSRIAELIHQTWRRPDPSFLLDFTDAGSGIVNTAVTKGGVSPTFTRATTATTVLANGLIGSVASGQPRSYWDPTSFVTNMLPRSQVFTDAVWDKQLGTVEDNLSAAPDGTNTAARFFIGASTPGSAVLNQTNIAFTAGTTYTASIHFNTATESTAFSFYLAFNGGPFGSERSVLLVNPSTLEVVPSQTNSAPIPTHTLTSLGKGWYRLTLTAASPVSAAGTYVFRNSDPNAGGKSITVWGAQLERAASVGKYVVTGATAAAAYGQYLGYLSEGARTNLLLRSEEFDNASWTKTDVTVTPNSIAAPDGAVTADLLTAGTAGTSLTAQTVTASADAAYSISVFAKMGNTPWLFCRLSATGASADFWWNLSTGVVGSTAVGGTASAPVITIQSYPNGWYRLTAKAVLGGGQTSITTQFTNVSADAVTTRVNNSTVYLWGAQFENGPTFASTYIPTTTGSVARNADSLTYPITGWLNTAAGTLVANAVASPSSGYGAAVGIFEALAATEGVELARATDLATSRATIRSTGVVSFDSTSVGVWSQTALKRHGVAYVVNSAVAAFSGELGTEDTSVVVPSGLATLTVGLRYNGGGEGNQWGGAIRSIAYWNTRLDNATLQRLTGA